MTSNRSVHLNSLSYTAQRVILIKSAFHTSLFSLNETDLNNVLDLALNK